MSRKSRFFGWQVAGAAGLVAALSWGTGFYAPGVFLHALTAERGWPVSVVSAAITLHFIASAPLMLRLPALHRRFGPVAVTRVGGIALGLGAIAWAWAPSPAWLFGAALISCVGWSLNSSAAINAFVSPWFDRRRPAAIALAFNGASVGGVVMVPLWAGLTGALGFGQAALILGIGTALIFWPVAGRWFAPTPASMGLHVDDDPRPAPPRAVPPAGGPLWQQRRFRTLSLGFAIALLAQVGLLTQLFSLMVPALGTQGAGFALSLATICAVAGRTAAAWLLPPGLDRRLAAIANIGIQVLGCAALLAAGGQNAPLLVLGCVLFGLGVGNQISFPPLIAQVEWPPAEVGRVVAAVAAVNQVFYAFAPALFGALREVAGDWAAPAATVALYAVAAAVLVMGRREA